MKRLKSFWLPSAIGVLLIFALIHIAGTLKGDSLVFPGVISILSAFVRLLRDERTYLMMLTTCLNLLRALAISACVGTVVGLAEGLYPWLERLLKPLMSFLRAVPMIVLIILVMVLSPYERVPVIAASLMLIPMISEATKEGCRSIPPELIDVYRMNSDLNLRVLTHVYLPMMSGYLRQAFAEAAGTGMKLVITGEYMVQIRNSLGKAIFSSSYFNEYQDIYAYTVIMVLMILLLSELPVRLMRKWGK